jgi:hypothetical protein
MWSLPEVAAAVSMHSIAWVLQATLSTQCVGAALVALKLPFCILKPLRPAYRIAIPNRLKQKNLPNLK